MNVSNKVYFAFINNIISSYGSTFSLLAKGTSILKNCKSLFITYDLCMYMKLNLSMSMIKNMSLMECQ